MARFTGAVPSERSWQHKADELHQDVRHVLPLGGGGRLEGVVKFDGDVQVHSFHLLFCWLADLAHLLPQEVSISGYE